MKQLQIEYVPVDKISEYKHNAKLHPEEQVQQIANSIYEFGMNDPIAVDENNVIIEGHGRLLAIKKLMKEGLYPSDTVPIIMLDHLTDQQKKAYILAHNKLTLNSGFDIDILNSELSSIDEFDMAAFGFLDEKEEPLPEGKVKVDLTEKLPESRVMICSISTFGTDTSLFVEVALPQESADKFLDKYYTLDPDRVADKMREAIDEL